MKTKTLRNVDEETWKNFKTLAAENNVSIPSLLKAMVSEFGKNSQKFWFSLLNGDKLLSDNEAEALIKIAHNLRKEKGFR